MKHLSSWRHKRGATAANPKMMPWQHIGFGCSWRYGAKGKVAEACRAMNGGVLPDTGFPHVGDKAKEGQRAPTVRTRGEQGCISYNMHSFDHGRHLRVIPSKCAKRDGSSSSREVEEVVVPRW